MDDNDTTDRPGIDLFAELSDPSLRTVFERTAPNVSRQRKALERKIQKDIDALADGKEKGKFFSTQNGVGKFVAPYPHNGEIEHFVPTDRLHDLLTYYWLAVNEGQFDDQLAGTEPTAVAPKKKRAGWSEERRAAHSAKQAAKQSA